MAFPALNRSVRSVAAAIAAGMMASMLVAFATPAVASTPIRTTAAAVDPAFSGFADRLPSAVSAAADVAGQTPAPGDQTAPVSGTIAFPAGVDLAHGRTFVAAYAPGADAGSPLAAASVAPDGAYAMRAPQGRVILAVVSEGRAVFDHWGQPRGDIRTAAPVTLPTEGLVHDMTLQASALIAGSVTVPAGAAIAGRKVAVAVYPAAGSGAAAAAANFVTDSGRFAVGGLPAGDYRVAFVSIAPGAVSEWWKDAPSFARATPVVLGANTRATVSAALESQRLMETSVPTVTGSPIVGQKLTAAPGRWTAGAAFSYQWYAGGAPIAKATAPTLVLPAAVAGKKITVRVTGAKASFKTTPVLSAATAAVVRPLAAPTPAIVGAATVGQKLTVKTGTWTAGARLSYQWYIDGVAVSRTTGAAFTIPAAATRKTITVVVHGTKSGHAAASKRSRPTAAVKGLLQAPAPKISGSVLVGSRLTAVPGAWTSGTTLRYQWHLNGKPISRATGSTLVVTAAMVKSRITVTVTGSKDGYLSAARSSGKTGVVTYPSRTKPSSSWNCPKWAPIKGNASSMIFHVPSGAYYSKTKPEECFSTEAAAIKAGYRKSKR